MNIKPFILVSFFLFLGIKPTWAQKYEWVKFYQGNSIQQLSSLSADKSGNNYFTFNFVWEIKFDSMTVSASSSYNALLTKRNSSGKTLWYKVAQSISAGNNVYALGSTFNSKGNILVFILTQTSFKVANDTIKHTNNGNYGVYLIELDTLGNLKNANKIIEGPLQNYSYLANKIINDANDNLYLGLSFASNFKVFDTTGSTNINSGGNVILKFSNSGKLFKWYRALPSSTSINSLEADINGLVYVASTWQGTPSSFVFGGQTISRPQTTAANVFVFDKNGKDKNWFTILSAQGVSSMADIAVHDSSSVYVSGFFKGDSVKFGPKWQKTVSDGSYHFFARYKSDGTLVWAKHEDSTHTTGFSISNDYGSMTHFKDQFVYLSFFTYNWRVPIVYDGLRFSGNSDNYGMTLKFDERGNILWGFRTFYPFSGMGTDDRSNLYFGGWFENDSVRFGPFKAKGYQGDGFVGKTFDYAIFRGKVKSGPYCAGDTFNVPFTKVGTFADTNTFFAELSDEEGNFTGKERILGKLKTADSGTIVGTLPLFKVASSGKYRIRIRSTSPQAQSFYKLDTLRLLIYSRDKADPGPPETICVGDTIKLETYGGTKWRWNPKARMDDSTARTPLVWPTKTTKYKIIISDSSGCGEADTAIKTINVRKDLQIKKITLDTTVCIGASIKVIAAFTGGDSLNYYWMWTSLDSKGNYNILKSASGKLNDTLSFKIPNTEKDSMQILLALDDGCTHKTAFTTFISKISKEKAVSNFNGKDTTLCPNKPSNIIAKFSKGYPAGYNWQWYETNNTGFWIAGIKGTNKLSDTLLYTPQLSIPKNKKLRIILRDNCSDRSDTSEIKIISRDTLGTKLNTKDTILCKGNMHTWKAKGFGGVASNYQYSWINNSNGLVLSNTDSFTYIADSSMQVKLVLTDNCMPSNSSTLFTINVHPNLQLSVFNGIKKTPDTTLCYGQKLKLKAKGSGGLGKNYSYTWLINNTTLNTTDSFEFATNNYLPKSGGTQTLTCILKDFCTVQSDTFSFNITGLPSLSISATVTDSICFNYNSIFKATANGGNGSYQFRWLNENNILQVSADSLEIKNNNPTILGLIKRTAIANDGCTLPEDSVQVSSYLLAPLSYNLTSSDTCPITSAVLNMNIKGGNGNYVVNWFENNNPIGTSSGSKTITPKNQITFYKALLKDDCISTPDTATIQLTLKPIIKLGLSGFCFGDTSIFKITKTNLTSSNGYNWRINNIIQSNKDSVLTFKSPAIGTYKIQVSTMNGACIGSDSSSLNIIEKPKADFDYLRYSPNSNGFPIYFNNLSLRANTWNWYFNNKAFSNLQSPEFTFIDTGNYRIKLRVSNNNICFDSTEKIIPIFGQLQFYFPNAFSPNGNSINDGFGLNPSQYYLVKDFHLEIFNRWGELVFKTDDVREHWLVSNTINQREPQQGVYLFKALITDILDRKQELTGAVQVLK